MGVSPFDPLKVKLLSEDSPVMNLGGVLVVCIEGS